MPSIEYLKYSTTSLNLLSLANLFLLSVLNFSDTSSVLTLTWVERILKSCLISSRVGLLESI